MDNNQDLPQPIFDDEPSDNEQTISGSNKLSIVISLFLLVAIPIAYVAVQNVQDTRTQASESALTPPITKRVVTVCPTKQNTKVQRCRYIGAEGIQKAVSTAQLQGYIITIMPGDYNFTANESKNFSLQISNKKNLIIQGSSNSKRPHLIFAKNRGGVLIENSQNISLKMLNISGNTNNGLLDVRTSELVDLVGLNVSDDAADPVQILDSKNIVFADSQVSSTTRTGISITKSTEFTIENNIINKNGTGISASNSTGKIKYNLIEIASNNGIELFGNSTIDVSHNTVVNISGGSSTSSGITYQGTATNGMALLIKDNIITKTVYGIYAGPTYSADAQIQTNDIWDNKRNYGGLIGDKTGQNGNITANPLFDSNYCLKTGSPAFYNEGYMGHKGRCTEVDGPSPTMTVTPTISPTPLILKISPKITRTPLPAVSASACPTGTTSYFNTCNCKWTCITGKTPPTQCDRACPSVQ